MNRKISIKIIAILMIAILASSIPIVCGGGRHEEPLRKADLVAYDILRTSGINLDAVFSIYVYNNGNKTAYAPWYDKLVWDEGTDDELTMGYPEWTTDLPELTFGDYDWEWRATGGSHTVTLYVDWLNDIDEWDESEASNKLTKEFWWPASGN